MIFPRGSRVVIAALVLLANLAGPDLVCAEHGGHKVLAATPVVPEDHDTGEHHHGPAAPDDGCKEPALPNCCPALTSCSFSFDAGPPRTSSDAGPDGIPAVRWSGTLLSRSTSPDPPPPKA
jgi:hypothetical protein